MHIEVDYDSCDGHGLCALAAPEVFHLDDQDQLHVLHESPPAELHAAVEKAARRCPKLAITVRD